MNKILSKDIFFKNKIKTPKYIHIDRLNFKENIMQKRINLKKIKFPIVSKPVNEGSSLGVEVCMNKKLIKTINLLFKRYDELILEEYIGGQEIQVAVITGSPLGAIELIPKRLFYDYKAKYTKMAKTKHVMPARLSKKNIMKFCRSLKKLIKHLIVEE